jgi:polar amino acid transport system substrate-binding protein
MIKIAIGLLSLAGAAFLFGAQQPSSGSIAELAPSGKLRVGINFGNALLAVRSDGTSGGIAVDLARELSNRIGRPMEIISYASARELFDGAKNLAWDVAFLATDPDRAAEIIFTAPYLEIDTTYLVPPGSPLRTLADVDRQGIRISVSDRSAYDLFLTRFLKRAQLVRAPNVPASVELYFEQKLEALAGLKPLLMEAAERQPGSRVLEGRFTVVEQAVGAPRGHAAAAAYLRDFVETVKASGLVGQIIQKNGIRGVSVAPAARHVQ